MIGLVVDQELTQRFCQELHHAGHREIGGVLVGENLGNNQFRLLDFSIQRTGGSLACFLRTTRPHQRFLSAFFKKTGYDYERYNYLGEWHSHPCFTVQPSQTDLRQMQEIVEDPAQHALFAMLLIVRLAGEDCLEMHASAFLPNQVPLGINVQLE